MPRVKPHSPRLNRSHPLVPGLSSEWAFSEGGGGVRDLVAHNHAVESGGPIGWTATERGIGSQPVSASAQYYTLDRQPWSVADMQGPGVTCSILVRKLLTGPWGGGYGLIGGAPSTGHSDYSGGGLSTYVPAGNAYWRQVVHDGSSNILSSAVDLYAAGIYMLTAVFDSPASLMRQYTNGAAGLTQAFTPASVSFEPSIFHIGRRPSSGAPNYLGNVVILGAWTWRRVLPAKAIADLWVDPFAMYRSRRRAFFFVPAAGGAAIPVLTGQNMRGGFDLKRGGFVN